MALLNPVHRIDGVLDVTAQLDAPVHAREDAFVQQALGVAEAMKVETERVEAHRHSAFGDLQIEPVGPDAPLDPRRQQQNADPTLLSFGGRVQEAMKHLPPAIAEADRPARVQN